MSHTPSCKPEDLEVSIYCSPCGHRESFYENKKPMTDRLFEKVDTILAKAKGEK